MARKPIPVEQRCERCKKRPYVKTDDKGTNICERCALHVVDPIRAPTFRRNAPCPCGSGQKFKVCCLPSCGPFACVVLDRTPPRDDLVTQFVKMDQGRAELDAGLLVLDVPSEAPTSPA